MPTERDPSILARPTGRRLRARDALICVGVAVLLLLLVEGSSIRRSGEEMETGVARTLVLAVGHPAGWVADRLPFAGAADRATAWLSPDEDLGGPGGFEAGGPARGLGAWRRWGRRPSTRRRWASGRRAGRAAPAARDRRLPGAAAGRRAGPAPGRGRRAHGARRAPGHRDLQSELVDWGRLSVQQVRERRPDAVVMLLGANEGFPMRAAGGGTVQCCGPAWAAEYATRARRMMDTYRRRGAARVYWLTLPAPRDGDRADIARTINAAIAVAAQPYRAQVRVLDLVRVFTPGGRFRDAMPSGAATRSCASPTGSTSTAREPRSRRTWSSARCATTSAGAEAARYVYCVYVCRTRAVPRRQVTWLSYWVRITAKRCSVQR